MCDQRTHTVFFFFKGMKGVGKMEKKTVTEATSEMTAEETQKLLEKYDAESNTRNLSGIVAWIVFGLLITFSLFQL